MSQDQITVLIPIFPGVNTLDVNGPLEVLCNYALRTTVDDDPNWCPFRIFIAAKDTNAIRAYEFIHMVAGITYDDALEMIADKEIDVLLTPGFAGVPQPIDTMIDNNDQIFEVIKAFFNQDSSDKERWIISICVGALLYAHAGVFNGTKATTHWGAVQHKSIEHYSHKKAQSVRERWYESPPKDGIRRLSSGGISCGLDATLYFLSQLKSIGLLKAQKVAQMMDYRWNGGPPSDLPITEQHWSPPKQS